MSTAFQPVTDKPEPEPLPEEVQTIELFSQTDADELGDIGITPNIQIQKTINLADYIGNNRKEITVNFNNDNSKLLDVGGISMESGVPCGIFIDNTTQGQTQVLNIGKKYPADASEKLIKPVKLDLSQTSIINFTLITPWAKWNDGENDHICYDHLYLTYSKSINETEAEQTVSVTVSE